MRTGSSLARESDLHLHLRLCALLQLNMKEGDWLRLSSHNPENDNILLIHGYAGGDNQLPTVVLRDGKWPFA